MVHCSASKRSSEPCAQGARLVEEVEPHGVIVAAVYGVNGKEAVGGLDEEAAQALHHAGADPDVGAPPVELRLVLRRAQQGRLQEEVVAAPIQPNIHQVTAAPDMQNAWPEHVSTDMTLSDAPWYSRGAAVDTSVVPSTADSSSPHHCSHMAMLASESSDPILKITAGHPDARHWYSVST